jgi:hypothetical protein
MSYRQHLFSNPHTRTALGEIPKVLEVLVHTGERGMPLSWDAHIVRRDRLWVK